MQKLTKFKVIFDLFTVCVYFIQQQNCKLYYIYLMIISEIQSEIGHCSCDSAKFKAPADFSHHAILCMTLSLKSPKRYISESVLILNISSSSFSIKSFCLGGSITNTNYNRFRFWQRHCLGVRYRTPRLRGYGSGTGHRATPMRTVSGSGSL